MNFINKFLIRLKAKSVGFDEFGNEYFEDKAKKRYCIYKGIVEPSKIPAEWHGWMHYNSDVVPKNINTHKFSWQKIHQPNLTGTKNSYSPKNSSQKNTSSEYEAWKPN